LRRLRRNASSAHPCIRLGDLRRGIAHEDARQCRCKIRQTGSVVRHGFRHSGPRRDAAEEPADPVHRRRLDGSVELNLQLARNSAVHRFNERVVFIHGKTVAHRPVGACDVGG
jgi:hypothetical protein